MKDKFIRGGIGLGLAAFVALIIVGCEEGMRETTERQLSERAERYQRCYDAPGCTLNVNQYNFLQRQRDRHAETTASE